MTFVRYGHCSYGRFSFQFRDVIFYTVSCTVRVRAIRVCHNADSALTSVSEQPDGGKDGSAFVLGAAQPDFDLRPYRLVGES